MIRVVMLCGVALLAACSDDDFGFERAPVDMAVDAPPADLSGDLSVTVDAAISDAALDAPPGDAVPVDALPVDALPVDALPDLSPTG